MTDSLAASSSRSKRRKGARSVSGCLTCRRRRVKCAVQRTPCDNCQRLTLTCTPSFHMNFKNWTPITGPSSAVDVPISASPEGAIPHDSSSRRKSGVTDAGQGNSAEVEEFPQGVILWLSSGLENGEFDLNHPSQTSTPSSASLGTHPRLNLEEPVLDNWTFQPLSGTITTTHLASPSSNSVIPGFSGGAFDRLEVQDESALASSSSFDFNMLGISTQMPQVYGNWDGEVPFLNGYEINMPKLLTSKSSPWNPYNYMLDSTRGNPDSPLRHGILSWTCSYLSCREQNSEYSGAVYYVSASSAAQNIISELTAEAKPGCLIGGNARRSEKLYMLLSTAFFLSHCDMMLCDYQSLYTRLDSIKELFEQHWHELKPSLSSLDCRLLTWLAYIDIRSSLFGNQKFRRIESSKQQRDLLSILVDLNALPFLRFVAEGRSYLSDCYGESYPKSELEEDLLQEPCHMKCDDVLSIFSTLNAFETWIAEYPRDESVNSVIEELRTAKIQALRANISRIRAECAVLFHPPYPSRKDIVDRTTFHALTVIALHLSATIMLNRILSPETRTDLEAQDAAHEIIRIAYRLRKAKYLDTPRSLLWPLPLFIAGIETTDEIYQDWILSYMAELQHWGSNIVKTRELLQQIIARQEREGRRVRVRDAMEDFKLTIII